MFTTRQVIMLGVWSSWQLAEDWTLAIDCFAQTPCLLGETWSDSLRASDSRHSLFFGSFAAHAAARVGHAVIES